MMQRVAGRLRSGMATSIPCWATLTQRMVLPGPMTGELFAPTSFPDTGDAESGIHHPYRLKLQKDAQECLDLVSV